MRCVICGNLNSLGSYDLRNATSRPIERNRDYFNLFDLLKVGKLYKLKLKRMDMVQAQHDTAKMIAFPFTFLIKRTANFVIGMVTKLIEKRDASVSNAFFAFLLPLRS